MRTLATIALLISLGVNAALAYLVFTAHDTGESSGKPTVVAVAQTAPLVTPQTWSQLSSDGDPALVQKLRAAGFPPSTVRAILRARISQQYEARMKALGDRSANRPFWKAETFDPEMIKAMRDISREQADALKRLMPDDAEDRSSALAKQYPYLSPEKLAQLGELLEKFGERRSALNESRVYDRVKTQALEKEQHDAIAALLSPDELFEYDIRNSSSASMLRDKLSTFSPTEEEFRAIFRLQQPFDAKYDIGMFPSMDRDQARQRADAERQLLSNIQSALTPDRASAYERMTDYNYRQTANLVARLQLPAQTADALYDLNKEFQQRQRDMYQPGAVTSREDMVAKRKALQEEAVAKATQILGSASAVDAYRQYGGQWIGYLVPPTARGR